jgi:hypothetical protein
VLSPPLREACEVEIGVGRDDRGATGGSGVSQARRHDHAGRAGAGELRLVARIGEEGDADRIRLLQRRDPLDTQFAVTKKIAAQGGDQFGQ